MSALSPPLPPIELAPQVTLHLPVDDIIVEELLNSLKELLSCVLIYLINVNITRMILQTAAAIGTYVHACLLAC